MGTTLSILLAAAGVAVIFMGIASAGAQVKGVAVASTRRTAIILGTLLIILSVFPLSYTQIGAGHRGVKLKFGAVDSVLDEGAHIIPPFIYTVMTIDVRTQIATATAEAASRDLQMVHTQVAINYHISPNKVGDLFKGVGLGYEERIIHPAVQETLKAVVAQYTAEELIRLRAKVKSEVDTSLAKRLAQYNIEVEPGGVSLTNFDFSEEFNKAIEAKQVAQQDSEKQKYYLSKAKMEAETAISQAKGEAEANRIKAGALNSTGGQKVLAREWINKWDGRLPTVMTGAGQSNIIDLRDLMGGAGAEAKKSP